MSLKRKKRVLAIDDEPAMTEWLKILLEHAGYEVRTALIGTRGEELFKYLDDDGKDVAVGQIYNLTDGEDVSKRRFFEKIADTLDLPRPTRTPPVWLARLCTTVAEGWAKLTGAKQAPLFTTAKLKFLAYNLDFSIQKAKAELGYQPRVNFDQGIRETMAWYRENA